MKMVEIRFLETCCCCCTLRTGTVIIGALSLLVTIPFVQIIATNQTEAARELPDNLKLVLKGCTVFTAISIMASTLLIIGAAKACRLLLLPWIVFTPIKVLLFSILFIEALASKGQFDDLQGVTLLYAVTLALLASLGLAFQIYLIIVVISHFIQLGRMDKESKADHCKASSA